ncbi:hypothetical protein TNCV_3059001 [Trichonephila clavipes]|nr:hypothetical protein TNCV_3059001 [Trichonephila clavipes]
MSFFVVVVGKEGKLPEPETGWSSIFHHNLEGEQPGGLRPPTSLPLPPASRTSGSTTIYVVVANANCLT